jgi:broad specificity phosphatase PhoE
VWLLRHGAVEPGWSARAYGSLDAPLGERGRAETAALARAFAHSAPAFVLSSPLARARALGEALAASCAAPLELEPRLRELERGAFQGRARAELDCDPSWGAYCADPWAYAAHGGESDAALLARAWPVFESACQRAAGALVLCAGHYNVARVLAARALGLPPARSFALRLDTGCGLLLVDGPLGFELQHANAADPRAARPEEPCASA